MSVWEVSVPPSRDEAVHAAQHLTLRSFEMAKAVQVANALAGVSGKSYSRVFHADVILGCDRLPELFVDQWLAQ